MKRNRQANYRKEVICLLRQILYHVSGEDPQYKTVAKEKTLRETVVDEAIKEIMTRPPEEERSIGMKYFRQFKGVPGFYTKFDSFIRQVRRSHSTF